MSVPTRPRTIADRYRLVREVGRGGMGSVWLAVDERLGREVAVKGAGHLPGQSATDQARALREARSSAALHHPHVVALYDAVPEGEQVWLVMEYVEGRTLAQLMREQGPLDPVLVAGIGAQVADGLAAAHERGTIHRDVKPGNILVTDDGTAKISDFGIARTLGEETLTEAGLLSGTPSYFSPELARGADPGPAADVWALGATLYAAVEGHTPYPDQPNALALLSTIADRRPPAPQRAGVLTEPIGRMMDPDPVSRWSMADASHALHQRAAAVPEPTREETAPALAPPVPPPPAAAPADPAPQPHRRHRAGWLAACVALLLLAVGGLWLASARDGAEPSGSTRTTPQQSAPTHHRRAGQRPTSTATVTATATATTTPEASAPAPAAGGASADQIGFVEDYYAVLPDDTRTGWSELTPAYRQQTGGYDDYAGFWDSVDSVAVEDARSVGANTVDVDLVYNGSDRETRRIVLERTADGWMISDSYLV